MAEKEATDRAERRAQVRGSDRSEKIRTYNAAQDRVTDHRLPLTMNGVVGFLEGDDGSLEVMADELEKWTDRLKIDDMLEASNAN
jgi:peptide chain release factor 1